MKPIIGILKDLHYELEVKGIVGDLELVVSPEAFDHISFEIKQTIPCHFHPTYDTDFMIYLPTGKVYISKNERKIKRSEAVKIIKNHIQSITPEDIMYESTESANDLLNKLEEANVFHLVR